MPYLGVLSSNFDKLNCHIWNQFPQICLHGFLTHTVNFGIGSILSKDPGSTFSEGSVQSQSQHLLRVTLWYLCYFVLLGPLSDVCATF